MLTLLDEFIRECLYIHEECLKRVLFHTLTEARVVIEDLRWRYHNIRARNVSLDYAFIAPKPRHPLQNIPKSHDEPTQTNLQGGTGCLVRLVC